MAGRTAPMAGRTVQLVIGTMQMAGRTSPLVERTAPTGGRTVLMITRMRVYSINCVTLKLIMPCIYHKELFGLARVCIYAVFTQTSIRKFHKKQAPKIRSLLEYFDSEIYL
ncbi:hypothetical protein [Marinifilum fragile]|uniref:hypothetical protein n=1 Tax=Marinifilum fragile TaxID=570161 RepID=UPI002AAB73BD|nr:hypothetical protein [Marinifilum fragile]